MAAKHTEITTTAQLGSLTSKYTVVVLDCTSPPPSSPPPLLAMPS